tara:strand:- start:464 stop:766 length:303 start_codon:yes stop_codon:yes gene_type:complete
MNRVTEAIEKMRKQIADRIATGQTTQAQVDALHKNLDMSWGEYTIFQNHKSAAAVSGKLTLGEAQTIYAVLGEAGPDKFNQSDIATKSVLTRIFAELLPG